MSDKQNLDTFFEPEVLKEESEENKINLHSKRVRRTKVFLPIVAVFFIGLLLIIPSLRDQIDELKFDITKPKKGELEKLHVENTVFYITDANNKVSNFNTDHIDETEPSSKIVKLNAPNGKISTKKDSWIDVTSKVGFYNQETKQLSLKEKIDFFFSEGMDLTTTDATFDFHNNRSFGNKRIKGRGYLGEIDSEGFEYFNETKTLILKGKTRIILNEESFKEKK